MSKFIDDLQELKGIIYGLGSSARADDSVLNKSIFLALSAILESCEHANEKDFSAVNLAILEGLCSAEKLTLIRSYQYLLVAIYKKIIIKSPGYIIRNILNGLLNICNGKFNNLSKETTLSILQHILENKSKDIGSSLTEIITVLTKLSKISDNSLRSTVFKTLISSVKGAGSRIIDLHSDIIKLANKFSTDRIVDIRYQSAKLSSNIAIYCSTKTVVTVEQILAVAIKGLEDESAIVQQEYASLLATCLVSQIHSYNEEQEQAKVGLARGADDPSKLNRSKSQSVKRISLSLSSKQKLIEQFDFKSVVDFMVKQVTKSTGNSRAGFLTSLGLLIKALVDDISTEESSWLITTVIDSLHDAAFQSLTYEESAYLRTRISHLIRSSIISVVSEQQLLAVASTLSKLISNIESSSRTELELELVLTELNYTISVLGIAAVSLVDEIKTTVNVFLRNAGFGVRFAAASILSNLCLAAPTVAVDFLRSAILNMRSQAKQLVSTDLSSGLSSVDLNENTEEESGQKRNIRDNERLHRLFFFHGHTLVISILLKNSASIPTGLPHSMVCDIFSLGMELLKHDVRSARASSRHVTCSVVRSGSLIVSSCLSNGYDLARERLPDLLECCLSIVSVVATAADGVSGVNVRSDELLYEIMTLEAAVVCISSVLLFCPEALRCISSCSGTIVECLETCLKLVKNRYQAKLKTHFRYRTFHVILIECFTFLPTELLPSHVSQQLFIESLRVFRDAVSNGLECSCLSHFVPLSHELLRYRYELKSNNSVCSNNGYGSSSIGLYSTVMPSSISTGSSQTPGGTSTGGSVSGGTASVSSNIFYLTDQWEQAMDVSLLLLKLETHAEVLQKKEGEALLAIFGKNFHIPASQQKTQVEEGFNSFQPSSGQIDLRSIDSAITMLAVTFPVQTAEYQNKAIELCVQAISLFNKTTKSLGMFSSEEERKKRDRKIYVTLCTVTAAMSTIIREHVKISKKIDNPELTWPKAMEDILYDILSQPSFVLRSAGSSALAELGTLLLPNLDFFTRLSMRVRMTMIPLMAKKGENLNDFGGLMLVLAEVFNACYSFEEVKSVTVTTMFDSLSKSGSSIFFQSHAVVALNSVAAYFLTLSPGHPELGEGPDFVDKIADVVENTVGNIGNSEDIDFFWLSLIRLLNLSIAVGIKVKVTEKTRNRLFKVWVCVKQLTVFSTSNTIKNELLGFLKYVIPVDFEGFYAVFMIKLLKEALDEMDKYSFNSLISAVSMITSLFEKFSEIACEVGLDSSLFELIDHCCSSKGSSGVNTGFFSVVEVKPGVLQDPNNPVQHPHIAIATTNSTTVVVSQDSNKAIFGTGGIDDQIHRCLLKTIEALKSLIIADVTSSPKTRLTRWLLYLRTIALNLCPEKKIKSNRLKVDTTERAPEEDLPGDEEEGEVSDIQPNSGNISLDGFQKFVLEVRDQISKTAPALGYCRVQLKCVAVNYISVALDTARKTTLSNDPSKQGPDQNPLCTDVTAVRKYTDQLLRTARARNVPIDVILKRVPWNLSLFLTDLTKVACACATYTIDDKPILHLQEVSLKLLSEVVTLFSKSADPDALYSVEPAETQGENPSQIVLKPEDRILQQFLSQMLSAIRACWAATPNPAAPRLKWGGSILLTLLQEGFLGDPVAAKRLFNPVFGWFQDKNEDSDASEGVIRGSGDFFGISELNVALNQSTAAIFSAKLLLLLIQGRKSDGVSVEKTLVSSVRLGLLEEMKKFLPYLNGLWYDMVMDSSRVQQKELLGVLALFSGGKNQKNPELEKSESWEFNPRRGGLTYHPLAAVEGLIRDYGKSLMLFLSALSCLKPREKEHIPFLFTVTHAILLRKMQLRVNVFDCFEVLIRICVWDEEGLIGFNSWDVLFRQLFEWMRRQGKTDFSLVTFTLKLMSNVLKSVLRLQNITKINHSDVILTLHNGMLQLSVMTLPDLFTLPTTPEGSNFKSGLNLTSTSMLAELKVLKVPRQMLKSIKVWTVENNNFSSEQISKEEYGLELIVNNFVMLAQLSTTSIDNSGNKGEEEHEELSFVLRFLSLGLIYSGLLTSLPLSDGAPAQDSHAAKIDFYESIKRGLKEMISSYSLVSEGNGNFKLRVLCAQLYQDLLNFGLLRESGEGYEALVMNIGINVLTCWQDLLISQSRKGMIFLPLQLCTIILPKSNSEPQKQYLLRALLNSFTLFLQTADHEIGCELGSFLLPLFLTRLQWPSINHPYDELLESDIMVGIVKFFLIFFGKFADTEEIKMNLLEILLTPLCEKLQKIEQNNNFITVCGKTFTHLATNAPQAFRALVPKLSAENRATLQQVMTKALQQQNQGNNQQGNQVNNSSGSVGNKKLNLAQYKKK